MPRRDHTIGEAARLLGVSVDTVRRWDRAGRIRTRRDPANRRLVPAAEIDRLRASETERGLALVLAGCGGGGKLRVDAASSLTEVFQQLDPKAQFDFAGSDALAFQLEQGAKADVYASASPKYPEKLYREKLVEKPVVFATNTVVLIVPRGNPGHVRGLSSLMNPKVKLVLGAQGVPVGDYSRKILAGFCRGRKRCPRARIVSEEQDVKGVVAKVALGEADAGFVYATDVAPAGGKVLAIEHGGGRNS